MSKRSSKKTANAASLNLVLKELDKYDQDDSSSTHSTFGSLLGTAGKAFSTKDLPPHIQPLNYPIQNGSSNLRKQPPRKIIKRLPKVIAGETKTTPGALGGAALAEWLETRVPRDGLGHPAIASSYPEASDPYSCISGTFLPLWCFLDVEDSAAVDQYPGLVKQLPIKAVGLPLDDVTGTAGSWSSCMVTAFDVSLDRFIVSWSAGKRVGSPVMHRGLLCLEKDDCEAFVQRIGVVRATLNPKRG